MSDIKVIVGLGNPGREYEYTRHNIGLLVAERLARRLNYIFHKCSFVNARMAEAKFEEHKVYIFLPHTFMNNSGAIVKGITQKIQLTFENLLIICDDLNLGFGSLRIRTRGSDGGHNGLTSVINHLGTQDFPRLRIGISSPVQKDKVVDYVLGEFSRSERVRLDGIIEEASDCCLVWLRDGIKEAMGQFNRRKKDGE